MVVFASVERGTFSAQMNVPSKSTNLHSWSSLVWQLSRLYPDRVGLLGVKTRGGTSLWQRWNPAQPCWFCAQFYVKCSKCLLHCLFLEVGIKGFTLWIIYWTIWSFCSVLGRRSFPNILLSLTHESCIPLILRNSNIDLASATDRYVLKGGKGRLHPLAINLLPTMHKIMQRSEIYRKAQSWP